MRFYARLVSFVLLLTGVAASASAQRVTGLSDTERAALMPLLERGIVALIQSNADRTLKQISLATIVRAPADAVFHLVATPELYPSYMPNISEVNVLERHENMLAYEWAWRGALLDLHGSNAVTLYRPNRVETTSTSGDLGRGKTRWDFYPLGPDKSLVVESLFLDVRQANWITRQLVAADPSMMHAMNLSTGLVLMLGVKLRVEQQAGVGDGKRPTGGVSGRSPLDARLSVVTPALLPLLNRGELALIENDAQGRLRQATVFGKINGTADAARTILRDPTGWPAVLPQVQSTEVTSRTDQEVLFDFELGLPVVNVEGKMKMQFPAGGNLTMEVPEGDMRGGRWMWEFGAVDGQNIVAYSSRANIARANWLIGRLVQREPLFLHGLSCASNLIALHGLQKNLAQTN